MINIKQKYKFGPVNFRGVIGFPKEKTFFNFAGWALMFLLFTIAAIPLAFVVGFIALIS